MSDALSLTAFAAMVRSMREAQKEYHLSFDRKSAGFNRDMLERNVDRAIADIIPKEKEK